MRAVAVTVKAVGRPDHGDRPVDQHYLVPIDLAKGPLSLGQRADALADRICAESARPFSLADRCDLALLVHDRVPPRRVLGVEPAKQAIDLTYDFRIGVLLPTSGLR